MKKVYYVLLAAFVGMALSSCSLLGGDKETSYKPSDLQGKWVEDGTLHYICFSTESASSLREGYYWGYEWHEDDPAGAVYEQDVLQDRYGNGWFMYNVAQSEWLQINQSNDGWMEVPQVYTITELNATHCTYYKKGYKNEKQYYTKK